MASEKFGEKLEELDLSQEEIDRLAKCMKDEKFRDLLREYAEEISDPENRKRYEEEIAMLERDRGMDVKFINPKPGHVLKTSVNGNQKCFVNICTNDNLGQPRSRPSVQGNTRGMQWSIPHSVSQAREDVDKAGTKCMVYDVVFHPDTYYLLKKNSRFKKMIHDTALDAVERQFGVKLDKINIKTPKMTFKGLPMSSVIRTPHANGTAEASESSQDDVDVRLKPPMPPLNGSHEETVPSKPKQASKAQPFPNLKEEVKKARQGKNTTPSSGGDSCYIEPEYSIMHRGYFDMQNYRMAGEVAPDNWPKELVISIDLPLLSAANSVNLEVFERRLHLDSEKPAKYKLDFELPYPVDENKGFAKFDKSRHRLTITLEVLPAPPPPKLIPFTSPPLVAEVPDETTTAAAPSSTQSGTDAPSKDTPSADQKATKPTQTDSSQPAAKTKADKTKSGDSPKQQPSFVEEGRRHYQEGALWSDDDVLKDEPDYSSNIKLTPLTKNSAFLIDMVMKYEGLIRRCPQYAFQQDEHYVTFIIEVPHIFEESLWYAVYDNMLQFCCLSECLDDDMVNSVFQLWVEFDEACRVDPQRSRVDVSGNNAVFCLRKVEPDTNWHFLRAGFDKDNLESRRFATERNVCELYTLVHSHAEKIKPTPLSICKVVKEEKNLLILELEPKPEEPKANSEEPTPTSNGINSDPTPQEDTNGDEYLPEESPPQTKEDPTSFASEVQEHARRRDEVLQDSDDEDEQSAPPNTSSGVGGARGGGGLVTVRNSDGSMEEVIHDHVTKSAVTLTTDSLLFEIDDDV